MLIGEKPGSKKAKAEKLAITIYNGLEELKKKHVEAKESIDIKKKEDKKKPMIKSLF